MNTLRILFFIQLLALAACNGSDNDSALQQQISAIPNEATHIQALEARLTADEAKLSQIQLIGKLKNTLAQGLSPAQFRTMGEVQAVVSFGPCSTLGVLIGRGGQSIGNDPLLSPLEAFQQCTGYAYNIDTATDNVSVAARLYWDGPNCTGNPLEWNAGGDGYSDQVLQSGLVFMDPQDGVTELMVKAGQTPQPTQIQSVWVSVNPGCQVDQEVQSMYLVTPNDVSITGVPNNAGGQFQLSSP